MFTSIAICTQIIFGLCDTALAEKILKRGNGIEPQSLDPQKTTGAAEGKIILDQLEGLLSTAADGALIPGAAEKWEISEDGKTYTFFLRENAKWSNGDPVKAEDFVYAWRRTVDPKTASTWSYMFYPIQNAKEISTGEKPLTDLGVKSDGDYKFIVTLNEPTPYLLTLVAHQSMVPLHQKTIESNPDRWMRPESMVSNGAFIISEWAPQSYVKLKKNPAYWDAANVKLDGVIFYPIDDRQAEYKRFKAGDLDLTFTVPTEQIEIIKKDMPANYKSNSMYATYYYAFNNTRVPFDNPKIRQALSLAIDREKIVLQITKGDENPAYSFVPPAEGDYAPQEMQCQSDSGLVPCKSLTQEQRNKIAQDIFKEVGYNKATPIEIVFNTDDSNKKIAIAVAGMWKKVLGVETMLTNKEWKVYLASKEKREYDVFRQRWIADYKDPSAFLSLFRSDTGIGNTPGHFSPKYDLYLDESAKTTGKKRIENLANAEKELMSNFVIAPIYYFVTNSLVSEKVSGYKTNAMDHHLSRWIDLQE